MAKANEAAFQNDVIEQMVARGWQLGESRFYNRETALYESDLLHYVQTTQPEEWKKFSTLYPNDTERRFCDIVVSQLEKADINATDHQSRTYGTLGVLRHNIRSRNTRFFLCQFKPEHNLNPDTVSHYENNILRLVPELVYSPHATSYDALDGSSPKAKRWRIDLVLFVNGIPVATMELKSEFKQSVDRAITQYKKTRLPQDPITKKKEPLLSFKRGALVHFAVSQFEVYMTTRLNGEDTYFLPFNQGTKEGGAGNDIPEELNSYATAYLWNQVLEPENLLTILGRFVHLQINTKEDWQGRRYKDEVLIFPRYHQWDVVTKLLQAARSEGTGHKYLVQHSAGSGKSNSIAWLAHQLSTLWVEPAKKQFDSVIVITDRTVLDSQLQDTIYQFEHAEGVVGRINHQEGTGSKSEKLAQALEKSQPIIIVTIQTFPHVLDAIERSAQLKERCYAIIADEAHSSQTGKTAKELREVLMLEAREDESPLSQEDLINASLAARRGSQNLSYYAFTATPKSKTIELFGRLPHPELPPSATNKPVPYHVYSMRQAIEEGFILDVLQNYTNYKVVYQLKQQLEHEQTVDVRRAKIKLNQWVRLHDHNISQKVKVIVEHFKNHVANLLNGQAKAMVVTSSRKEAVRYKLAFDAYIAEKNYQHVAAMVAFSGEVSFSSSDNDSEHLLHEKFTENSMNPGLKGREMRKAFDSDDYQVMIAANKFQTGFDQPKLCAMYVDKKLGGVECVQTLSRLNRTYPGKVASDVYVLDFFNEPDAILQAFQPYYQTATLEEVSDPDKLFDLFEKLKGSRLFLWSEVEQFTQAYFSKNQSNAAISNICKPAVVRWAESYRAAIEAYKHCVTMLAHCQRSEDPVLIANAEQRVKEAQIEKDRLDVFKSDLGAYVRKYEFMSQIVDYDDPDLEKLSLYARHLAPLLREQVIENDEVDLSHVVMSHYRLSKIREQELKLSEDRQEPVVGGDEAGSAKPKDKKEAYLSVIIARLNEVFAAESLTDSDMLHYATTIVSKIQENSTVMNQVVNNPPEQVMLGAFPQAVEDAIFSSSEAHQEQMGQLLSSSQKMDAFVRVVFDMVTHVLVANNSLTNT